MKLKEYYNKKVNITDISGILWEGIVTDYIFPEDNEPQIESIVLRTKNNDLIEFFEKEIQKIDLIS